MRLSNITFILYFLIKKYKLIKITTFEKFDIQYWKPQILSVGCSEVAKAIQFNVYCVLR